MSRLIHAAHSVPAGRLACPAPAAPACDAPGCDALVEFPVDELFAHADIIEAAASASRHARTNSNARDHMLPPVGTRATDTVRGALGKHILVDSRTGPEFRSRGALGRTEITARQRPERDDDPLEIEPRIDHPEFNRMRACCGDRQFGVLYDCIVGDPLRPKRLRLARMDVDDCWRPIIDR